MTSLNVNRLDSKRLEIRYLKKILIWVGAPNISSESSFWTCSKLGYPPPLHRGYLLGRGIDFEPLNHHDLAQKVEESSTYRTWKECLCGPR
jgi:hypothetical protein